LKSEIKNLKLKNSIPPKSAQRLLLCFLRDDLAEEVSGDLEEKFYLTLKKKSLRRAKLNYWYQVFNYLRPFAIRKSKSIYLNQFDMFQNYFKITVRNLLKQKLYSVINIGGLSIGLACFIMMMLYVQHEFSYDRFYENADHIYRIYQRQSGNVFLGSDYFAVTPAQLASVLREEFPEVSYATSVEERSALVGTDVHSFWEKGLAGDPQFFDVFTFSFLKGNPKEALKDIKSIILTRTLADKIFGDDDPIGQSLRYQNGDSFTVTGVINDPPANSSIQFSFVVNILSNQWYAEQLKQPTWNNNSFHTFFVLSQGASPGDLQKKFPALLKKYQDRKGYANYPFKDEYFIQDLPSMHLQPAVNFDIGIKGNQRYVYLFSAVALIVLLLACVNYMNLAVARSIKRAREVGLRKVVGAVRRQLIGQFLGESVLIAFLSLVLAVGLTYLLLPVFGQLMERPIELNFFSNPLLLPGLLLLVILVGLFSGSYPAFFMSSLRPVQVLNGKVDGKSSGSRLQRWIIVGQYAVSIVLVTSSLIIYNQLQYMQQKDLGYDREDVIAVQFRDQTLLQKYEALRTEWRQHPDIIATTASTHLPINITSSHLINDEDNSRKEDDLAIYEWRVNYDFHEVFGMKLIAGRTFSREIKSDINEAYLLNETATKALGWTPEAAIGKQILDNGGKKTIVGVVKDFHMHSMHLPIQPLIVRLHLESPNFIFVKVRPQRLTETIAFMEKTIKKLSPYPFEYRLLDEHFDQLYKSEMKMGEIFGFFTLLSILIASLGLFGLAAFMSGQRTKEIGIRKVLGASAQSIVFLLTKDFLSLVGFAFLLSIPIAWYIMREWLQDFAYRIEIEWWMFAAAGVLALLVANLAIGYQSLKASSTDPVDSLRSE
jgi:putative ABC transport system permease protein